jgi:hypothetical protein
MMTMTQEMIESLSPEDYSLFLADGSVSTNNFTTAPHNMLYFLCENGNASRITWV